MKPDFFTFAKTSGSAGNLSHIISHIHEGITYRAGSPADLRLYKAEPAAKR